eukprot:UN23226
MIKQEGEKLNSMTSNPLKRSRAQMSMGEHKEQELNEMLDMPCGIALVMPRESRTDLSHNRQAIRTMQYANVDHNALTQIIAAAKDPATVTRAVMRCGTNNSNNSDNPTNLIDRPAKRQKYSRKPEPGPLRTKVKQWKSDKKRKQKGSIPNGGKNET